MDAKPATTRRWIAPDTRVGAYDGERAHLRGLGVRIGVVLRRGRLDRELAAGISPAVGRLHASRAAQLTARACRTELADILDLLSWTVCEPPSLWRIEPKTAAIDRNQARIDALASRLRGPTPMYASGIAKLLVLLRDGTGPLYTDSQGKALEAALVAVDNAMSH